MIEIKDLLFRFSNLFTSIGLKNDLVAETISAVSGVEIKKDEVEIKDGTIYLNIKPIYKNEIFKKREEIFSKLSESMGKNYPKDIR